MVEATFGIKGLWSGQPWDIEEPPHKLFKDMYMNKMKSEDELTDKVGKW